MSQTDKIFFTSDHHFFHHNIIKYCNRPYGSLEEMHEDYIAKWNEKIPKDGLCYYLGDFFISSHYSKIAAILERLHGRVILIKGNHDHWAKHLNKLEAASKLARDKILSVHDYLVPEIALFGTKPVLFHFPIENWDRKHYFSYHLHGHSHGTMDTANENLYRLDVGVDSSNGIPLGARDVSDTMSRKLDVYLSVDKSIPYGNRPIYGPKNP